MVSFKTFGWRIVELFAPEQQNRQALRTTTSVRHFCFGSTRRAHLAVRLRVTPQFSIQMFCNLLYLFIYKKY
jgi:hypothetical protein